MKKYSKTKIFLIILFIDIALLVILFLMGNNLNTFRNYGDSGSYIEMSKKNITNFPHFPLYSWIIGLIRMLLGNICSVEIYGILVSIIFHSLTGVIFFNILKQEHFNDNNAIILSIILSLFPVRHLIFSLRILPDAVTTFFVVLSFYYLKKEKDLLAIIFLAIASISHYIVIIFFASFFLYYLLKKKYLDSLKSILILLPFLLLSLYQYFKTGDILFYISVHNQYVKGNLMVFPFSAFVNYIVNFSKIHFAMFIYIGAFISLYMIGFIKMIKEKMITEISWTFPILLFLSSLNSKVIYYELDRFLVFAFPILIFLLKKYPFSIKNRKITFTYFIYFAISLVSLFYFFVFFSTSKSIEIIN